MLTPYLNLGEIYSALDYYWDHIEDRIDFVENMCTGINKIRTLLKEAGESLPEFEFGNFYTIIFPRTVVKTSEKTPEKTSEKHRRKHRRKLWGKLWGKLLH